MKHVFTISLMILFLSSCASVGRSSNCPYKYLVGQNVHSADIGAIRAQGKEARILYPDSFLGFERNPNRVNITRDMDDQIVDVTCG